MKVLITGVAGFVGGHLVDLLRADHPDVEVIGLDNHPGNRARSLGIEIVPAELLDEEAIGAVLRRVRPDRIVHLAAQSNPQLSWSDPAATLKANVLGLLHLLEGARRSDLAPAVLVVGSAEEYGLVDPSQLPLSEDAPLRPTTPYAVSKVAQGFLALQYTLSAGLPIVRTRTFHHTGPRRGESFAESSFARQLAEIEAGQRPPVLEVGNLEAVRDFTDVRDVVRAYWALLDRGRPGEVYNVCSGRGVAMRALLEGLMAAARVTVEVRTDPARLRPLDVPVVVGDPTRLKAATAWEPVLPLQRTLEDLLDHWRERIGQGAAPARRSRP